jgi:hypothetical protein
MALHFNEKKISFVGKNATLLFCYFFFTDSPKSQLLHSSLIIGGGANKKLFQPLSFCDIWVMGSTKLALVSYLSFKTRTLLQTPGAKQLRRNQF